MVFKRVSLISIVFIYLSVCWCFTIFNLLLQIAIDMGCCFTIKDISLLLFSGIRFFCEDLILFLVRGLLLDLKKAVLGEKY